MAIALAPGRLDSSFMAHRDSVQSSFRRGVHVPALDGVRGLAILLVLVFHATLFGGAVPASGFDEAWSRVALLGWSGVDLFFVLSGFLITGILYDSRQDPGYFRTFYMRRVLRIFPLYYGSLVVFLYLLPPLPPMAEQFGALRAEQGWYWSYLVNFRFAGQGWPDYDVIGHFWSLAVEEQFYMVWPLVVLLCRRRALLAICAACVGLALAARCYYAWRGNWVAAYVLMYCRMDALAAGAFVAVYCRDPGGLDRLIRWARPAGILAVLGLAAIFVYEGRISVPHRPTHSVGLTLVAVAFTAALILILAARADSRRSRFFTSGPLRYLGRYSYGVYVFHQPVILYFAYHGFAVPRAGEVLGGQLPGQIAFFAAVGALSLGAAVLSWHAYEVHFLRLKRYFRYR